MDGKYNYQEVDDAFTLAKTLWGSNQDQERAQFYIRTHII